MTEMTAALAGLFLLASPAPISRSATAAAGSGRKNAGACWTFPAPPCRSQPPMPTPLLPIRRPPYRGAGTCVLREKPLMPDLFEQFDAFLGRWCEFPDDELAKTRQVFRPVTVLEGGFLTRARDRPDRVAFIGRGLVRLYYTGADGMERAHGFRAENHLVCAYSAALRREPAHVSIQALEACSLLVASRAAFEQLRAHHQCWRELTRQLTEELYLSQERRLRELLLDDAATRYRGFITEYADLARRLTQRQIASYIGITPVALSRIRTRLISVNDTAAAGS
jgi:CRP-like cAMP-binding protein